MISTIEMNKSTTSGGRMRVRLFLICCLTICSTVIHADLLNHLKKIDPSEKNDNHKIRNVDFIYMINLDRRPEKFEQSCKQLQPYGITPFRFSAVNGWELSFETVNDIGVKYQPGMSKNLWGTCYLPEGNWNPH